MDGWTLIPNMSTVNVGVSSIAASIVHIMVRSIPSVLTAFNLKMEKTNLEKHNASAQMFNFLIY